MQFILHGAFEVKLRVICHVGISEGEHSQSCLNVPEYTKTCTDT